MKISEAIYEVVEHYTKTSRESWISITDSDTAVIGQVEDVVNEIRWKLSVNAVKLFKVCHFKFESCQTDSMKTVNPRGRIQHFIESSHEDSLIT